MEDLTNELKAKLLAAKSAGETAELLREAGAKEEGGKLLLCDGKARSTASPKKKNKKHLALLVNGYEKCDIKAAMPDDIMIRKMIREYKKVLQNTKEEDNV